MSEQIAVKGAQDYLEIDWDKASCRGMPTNFFYRLETDRNIGKLIETDIFRMTCTACPLWSQCLGYASENEKYGVWGGMTPSERRSFLEPNKSAIRKKVISDFKAFGITEAMIWEAIE